MTIEYSIEPFGPKIVDAYRRLFPNDADKNADVLKWRFVDNPHGEGVFATAMHEKRICGLISLVPTQVTSRGRVLDGWQAIDTIVDPAVRGKFIFMRLGKLAEEFVAERSGLLWGFPNASAARGWFGRLGWTRSGTAPFLIKPLRTGLIFKKFAPVLSGLDFRLYAKRKGPGNVRVESVPPDLPHVSMSDLTGVNRESGWLSWRLSKPGAHYRIFRDGEDQFTALRIEQKHGGRIAYVMEAQSATPRTLHSLIRATTAFAGEDGADAALAWCNPHSPNYQAYRKAGFLPFPDRIRPIEIHHGYWQSPMEKESEKSLAPWYLSYLDSDTV